MAHSGWYHVHFLFWPWRKEGGRFPSLRGAFPSNRSEWPQNPKINHPLHGEMDTSRIE